MNDRGSDVYSVNRGLWGHGADTNRLFRKAGDLLRDVEQGELLQDFQPKTCHGFIAPSRFIDHRLGSKKIEGCFPRPKRLL
jgi:hypothetical protein